MSLIASTWRIGVFGEFSAGKSTLLNSVVGKAIQETSVEPTTSQITIIAEDATARDRAIGRVVTVSGSAVVRWGVQLLDTPGWNDGDARRTRLAIQAADLVDEAYYVVDATKGAHRSDIECYRRLTLATTRRGRPAPALVLAHFDRVVVDDSGEEDDLIADLAESFNAPRGALFRVDARSLSTLDGPRLLARLSQGVVAHGSRALLSEVQSMSHPLRRIVVEGRSWRASVDESLVLPATSALLDQWVETCGTARLERARARRRAYTHFPVRAARRAIEWHRRSWLSFRDGALGWRAGALARERIGEACEMSGTIAAQAFLDKRHLRAWAVVLGAVLVVGPLLIFGGIVIGAGTGGWGFIVVIPIWLFCCAALIIAFSCLLVGEGVVLMLAGAPVIGHVARVLSALTHGVVWCGGFAGIAAWTGVRLLTAPLAFGEVSAALTAAEESWRVRVGLSASAATADSSNDGIRPWISRLPSWGLTAAGSGLIGAAGLVILVLSRGPKLGLHLLPGVVAVANVIVQLCGFGFGMVAFAALAVGVRRVVDPRRSSGESSVGLAALWKLVMPAASPMPSSTSSVRPPCFRCGFTQMRQKSASSNRRVCLRCGWLEA